MMMNPYRRWNVEPEQKQKAIDMTVSNLSNDDGRVSCHAVANLLKMESQNQADDLADKRRLEQTKAA